MRDVFLREGYPDNGVAKVDYITRVWRGSLKPFARGKSPAEYYAEQLAENGDQGLGANSYRVAQLLEDGNIAAVFAEYGRSIAGDPWAPLPDGWDPQADAYIERKEAGG